MLSSQWSVVFKWTLVGFCCCVLLTTETSGDPVDVRLVGGGNRCSGRLEMKHQGQWRIFNIRDGWMGGDTSKVRYAQVACRQMDCGTVISIRRHIDSTVKRPVWEANSYCRGTEHTFSDCNMEVMEKHLMTYSMEVVCSESVRFGNGASICSGKVEVKSDNGWAPVCEDGFDSETQKMVCREFGCGPPKTDSPTAEGALALSKKFQCKGNETRLQDCASSTHNCKQAPSLTCHDSHDVRLHGGNGCEGTLEGKFHGEWRPLMDLWGHRSSQPFNMICKNVGCGTVISKSHHEQQWQLGWQLSSFCWSSDDIFCQPWIETSSTTIINMTCAENVRLVGWHEICSGMLEVKSGQSWAPVCKRFFTKENAQVACAESNCGFLVDYHERSDRNPEQIMNPVFKCGGKEKNLLDCPTDTLNVTQQDCGGYIEIVCKERPKMPSINLLKLNTGNVNNDDKFMVLKGQRFAISCSIRSPLKPLSIRLRYGDRSESPAEWIQPATEETTMFFFPPTENTHEGSYQCDYNYEFRPEVFSEAYSRFLIVNERHDVRLVDGHSRCAGRLEVEHQENWISVSYQHSWSLKEAAVVCRQLRCGAAVSTHKVDNSPEVQTTWRFLSNCNGSEHALMDCGVVKKWPSSSSIELFCADILHEPSIAIISGPFFTEGTVHKIFKGHSINVNCSVEPQYPGGHFSLIINNLNQTHSLTQPAVHHSVIFTLTAIEGNYSCAYHNFVFNHNFSSESSSFSIQVSDNVAVTLDNDDNSPCSGKVLVDVQGELKQLSAESALWDLKHASVVCRQLGCGAAVSTNAITLPTKEKMAFLYSDCDGSESALLDCGATVEWFSSSYVEVKCKGHSIE